jgi:hypothetical protein
VDSTVFQAESARPSADSTIEAFLESYFKRLTNTAVAYVRRTAYRAREGSGPRKTKTLVSPSFRVANAGNTRRAERTANAAATCGGSVFSSCSKLSVAGLVMLRFGVRMGQGYRRSSRSGPSSAHEGLMKAVPTGCGPCGGRPGEGAKEHGAENRRAPVVAAVSPSVSLAGIRSADQCWRTIFGATAPRDNRANRPSRLRCCSATPS